MTAKNKIPKGGRKGGTKFPRISLPKAIEYSVKLVTKTHVSAQPREIIGPGVFGTAGTSANERISALRQFDLLKGNDKAYEATDFARELAAAPSDERTALLHRACLKPAIFKNLYSTFLNDIVAKAKVKQQVLGFKVHPDYADTCVDLFLESASAAGLCSLDGDSAKFEKTLPSDIEPENSGESEETDEQEELPQKESSDKQSPPLEKQQSQSQVGQEQSGRGRASVEIKIDPSMDPEKLDKLLNVLKRHGQI